MIAAFTLTPWIKDMLIYSLVIIGIAILYSVVKTIMKTRKVINDNGPLPEKETNYTQTFIGMLAVIGVILYLLVLGLQNNVGNLNTFMFSVFPYLAFLIFIIGSIYRYKNRGFQVSSLSTQFLEGKQLFWGSQPFHWGLLVTFFGHLIAFSFPRTLLAWNGEPVRLLILEVTAFIFGLSALIGLILLIKRRLSSKRLYVVANKMDMLVYVTLFVQIVSGVSIAFFERWATSWFAGVLTPYLRSVFAFDPDIAAVSAMPWIVQLHIISAFAIIGIIPFTRFMHFLVVPIDYIWRDYQLVIWNWNKKTIRSSKKHFNGKMSKNH